MDTSIIVFSFHSYLFIRGLHDRDEVLAARLAVLRYIQDSGEGKLKVGHPWEDGLLNQRCGVGCVPFMEASGGAAPAPELVLFVFVKCNSPLYFVKNKYRILSEKLEKLI